MIKFSFGKIKFNVDEVDPKWKDPDKQLDLDYVTKSDRFRILHFKDCLHVIEQVKFNRYGFSYTLDGVCHIVDKDGYVTYLKRK